MTIPKSFVYLLMVCMAPSAPAVPSIAQTWDEQALAAIRIDRPNPPVHARNLFGLSVAMYDAWAAYGEGAVGFVYRGSHTANDVAAARHQAISYAAYRILKERFALSLNSATTLATLNAQMAALGYNTANTSLDTATPAGVGNSVAAAVSAWFINDGARQLQSYTDYPTNQGGYLSVNAPLYTNLTGTTAVDVNHWQPLYVINAVDQNGNPTGSLQTYVGAQWLGERPFSLTRSASNIPWIDPGPQPRLNGVGDAQFRSEVVDVIRRSSELTPDDGVMVDISPGALGNNSLGENDGNGHPLNPSTGLPYAPNNLKRGDFARVLAEYWADGPSSETPPGHWNVIANNVRNSAGFVKKIGGTGPELDDLEWDVKMYFSLNTAVHDAACAAWSIKRYYDGYRPISAIRYMGGLGQSSNGPSYHPSGLPLVADLIEVVTASTAQSGGRHFGLPIGAVAIRTWPGQPASPTTQYSGVKWIMATNWLPFQKKTFVTPAFPGYVSGHSTFSRAAAEVLTAITGSPYFPAGLATYSAAANTYLTFEKGPSQSVQLQWATYYDAADQAGQSRLWGGIHVSVDDLTGRRVGSQCGKAAWALASQYFDGSITQSPFAVTIRQINDTQCELKCDTVRGLYYKLQSTTDLAEPFVDDPAGFVQCVDSPALLLHTLAPPRKFYRYARALTP